MTAARSRVGRPSSLPADEPFKEEEQPVPMPADLLPSLAATLGRIAQTEAQREEARIYQLAFWPDDKRAMPIDFIACALFASIQEKDATYFDGVEIANANGFRITFKGKRLTQVHADVWQGIMHLARRAPQGTKIRFRSRTFLRLIGRHTGKSQRDQLHRWITDLVATNVEITDTTKKRRYFGSMLPEGGRDESHPTDAAYVVEINRHLCRLFQAGFSTVNWEQRQKLGGKWLALWLHHYFSRFTKPVAVAELHRLSGSSARSLRHFREKLRGALVELCKVGLLSDSRIDAKTDTLFVALPAKELPVSASPAPAAHKPPRAALNEQAFVRYDVSDAAKARYCQLFGRDDVSVCLDAWNAWLTKSGRTAERPDGAFLGFAKKWAACVR
jgi:TrfA protein